MQMLYKSHYIYIGRFFRYIHIDTENFYILLQRFGYFYHIYNIAKE